VERFSKDILNKCRKIILQTPHIKPIKSDTCIDVT